MFSRTREEIMIDRLVREHEAGDHEGEELGEKEEQEQEVRHYFTKVGKGDLRRVEGDTNCGKDSLGKS